MSARNRPTFVVGFASLFLAAVSCCGASPAGAEGLALQGYGPDEPSVPFNVLHWRLDPSSTRPRHRGPDYTDIPPECVIVTSLHDIGYGDAVYRSLACPR